MWLSNVISCLQTQRHTDNELGILDRSTCRVNTGTKCTEAMIVGRAHLNQRHVQVQDLTSEQQRDLAEEDGSEISTAFVD